MQNNLTLTEQKIIGELIKSKEFIFNNTKLLLALKKNNFRFRTAFILGHTPEQGEDIYVILSNDDEVLTIEVDRFNGKLIVKFIRKVNDYRRKLKKRKRIKLNLALQLVNQDL